MTRILPIMLLTVLVLSGWSGTDACSEDEIDFQTGAEGMPLFDLARWIGAHVEGSVTFAPQALKIMRRPEARVVVSEPVRIPRARVLGFGQDLLAPHGLVLFNIGRPEQPLWLVESTREPTVLAGRTVFVAPEAVEQHRYDRVPITTAIDLEKIPLGRIRQEVLEAVKGEQPEGTAVIPVGATNGFILRGPGRTVYAWKQLIERLDRPPSPEDSRGAAADEGGRTALLQRLERLEARVAELETVRKETVPKR